MKKYILFIAIMALSLSASAQKGLHVGLISTVGPVYVVDQHLYGNSEPAHSDFKFSHQSGIQIGYNFLDNLGVFTEFNLARLGDKRYEDFQEEDWQREIDFDYYLIPVMLKYTSRQGNTRFFAEAGLQFGLLNKVTQTYTGEVPPEDTAWIVTPSAATATERLNGEITDRFEDLDMTLTLTLGANVNLSQGFYLNVGMRFNGGLLDINKEEWRYVNRSGEYEMSRHIFGGLNVGLTYHIGGSK